MTFSRHRTVAEPLGRTREDALAGAAVTEGAASFVLHTGLVEAWVEGAIFPSEMAFFLAACETLGVRAVVESGRQDGYSTEILGRWAVQRDVEIVSIDLEQEPDRAADCRQRLRSLPLTLVKGNAYSEVGAAVRRLAPRPTAILVDGPKGWPALSLVAASLEQHVRLVSFHNLADWVPQRQWFVSRGGRFYEDEIPEPGPSWSELRRREIEHTRSVGAVRSQEVSSLGILTLDDERAARFRSSWGPQFGLHQPAVVRMLWQVAGFSLTPKLYGLSYKMLGR